MADRVSAVSRCDHYYQEEFPFADYYPVDRPDGLSSIQNMLKEATGIGDLRKMQARNFGPHNAFSVGSYLMKKTKNFRISPEYTDIFPVCLISPRSFSAEARTAGTTAKPSLLMTTKNAVSLPAAPISVIFPHTENHDEPRGVSQLHPDGDLSLHSKKLATMYFMLRPAVYLSGTGDRYGKPALPVHRSGR